MIEATADLSKMSAAELAVRADSLAADLVKRFDASRYSLMDMRAIAVELRQVTRLLRQRAEDAEKETRNTSIDRDLAD